jgi:steroid delta-isomerase-like uncharacterized protein
MDTKQVVSRYLRAYTTGRPDSILELLASDYVYHGPAGMPPLDYGKRGAVSKSFLSSFSNVEVEIADQIAEGDRVATRVVMRANHAGTYLGIPPTHRTVVMPFLDIALVHGDLIVEEWAEFDMAAILRQIS